MTQINYDTLLKFLADSPLAYWAETLPEQIKKGLCEQRCGDLSGWKQSLAKLPNISTANIVLDNQVKIGTTNDCDENTREQIKIALQELIPWRKGPYTIHDIHIDTEWRSDWKWDRVLPHLAPLKDKFILDVGCGNGYHCWRMLGAGASRVIGIDPSPRFIVQFQMIKHFVGEQCPIDVLPLGIEDLPEKMQAFDSVFSMGVFYHRRSPMDHLQELKNTLKPGGQLILETLIIDGKLGDVLVPEDRYAKMNNVWFLPSADTLISWMKKMGFKNPRVVDICPTTTDEQRTTEWMTFHSLAQFLDPANPALTAEGHPAPIRAVFVAEN
jgi:tRNA (mo5U34)-methyltransferase